MSDYYSVYRQRLNRYGLDYQSRIQGTREKEFDKYLYKTVYRVDFQYNDQFIPGSLERYKQDASETLGYLLTRKEDIIPGGTVLFIESQDGRTTPWMIWWLEHIEASGYNKYVVLKMTHNIHCGEDQWGYLKGPGASAIRDTTVQSKALILEDNNLNLFITTTNKAFKKGYYFEVGEMDDLQAYVVTGVDNYSTPGVAYVSIDPVAIRDKTEEPVPTPADDEKDFFWLNGGAEG